MDTRDLMPMWRAGKVAREQGMLRTENPYSAHNEPDQHAAWADGWDYADGDNFWTKAEDPQ